jgi:hypothetical protein
MVLNSSEPLGLPKGSVRALIALSIVGAGIYAFLSGKISTEQFITVTSIVTGFYFATKTNGA